MSGYSTTPNLGLKKPISGADDDLWGTHWNDNADLIDSTVGALVSPPVTSVAGKTGAVTLVHTDITDWNTAVPSASTAPPLMDGVAAPGTSALYAREGHVHPSDTTRQTAAQVQAAVAPAFNGVGRNLIHNPLFNIAQRGAGPFTADAVFTLDRWLSTKGTGSASVQQAVLNDTQRAQIGDEAAAFSLFNTFAGGATAGDFVSVSHGIEGVRRLAGKMVTLSFWAAGTASLKLGASFYQVFGSGGSPSAVVTINGQSVALIPTFARYSLTFSIPSIAGKTLGTDGRDCTQLYLWLSSGATNNVTAGSIGVQSGTIQLWGVQLEIGTVATPLEKPDPRYDLANCQRFYQTGGFAVMGYSSPGGQFGSHLGLPVPMRAIPATVAIVSPSYTNASGGAVAPVFNNALQFYAVATATGAEAYFSGAFSASADL